MSIITFSVCKFQSTPSVGRATFKRAERNANRFGISIHALRGEGDMWLRSGMVSGFIFQSTPSVGRATTIKFVECIYLSISIHALRGEGDYPQKLSACPREYFNPRPPWGGRPSCAHDLTNNKSFQSTPSVGRATLVRDFSSDFGEFQSTPSVGRATKFNTVPSLVNKISIHALRGEGDAYRHGLINHVRGKFQSTPSVGRATRRLSLRLQGQKVFQSTPSVGRATLADDVSFCGAKFQSTPSVGRATVRRSLSCPKC